MRKIIHYILLLSFTLSVMCGGFYASAQQETATSSLDDIMAAHESEISVWFRTLPDMYHYKYETALTEESEYGFYGSYYADLPDEYSAALYNPDEQIVTLKSDIMASGELRYVKLWNPLDENGQYIGTAAYTDPEVKKEFLPWDEFLLLLDGILTQSAKNALLSSFIFKEQDGVTCMALSSLLWRQLYINRSSEKKSDFRSAENLELLAQTDNVAYLKAHPDYVNATVGSLWVYEYDTNGSKWLLAYTDYIFVKGLHNGDETFERYESLAPDDFASTNGNYAEKVNDTFTQTNTDYGNGLTDDVISELLSSSEKQLTEMLLNYNPYPFQNPSSREIVKLDEYGIAWCKLYNPFSDGTFIGYQGAAQNSFIKSGEQLWSDWEEALLNVFSKEAVERLKQQIMISEDGYICVKTTTSEADSGPPLPVCVKDAYTFLGFYGDFAIIERYTDNFDSEDYIYSIVPEDRDILILQNDNGSWKIFYYSDSAQVRSLFENAGLKWLGEYVYGAKRYDDSQDFNRWFDGVRDGILTYIQGGSIPDTSDGNITLSIAASVISVAIAFAFAINRRKNYEE